MACGVDYYALFKNNCNTSYAYAYDEKSGAALWTCSCSPDYTIEFCPAGSNYVGAKEASHEYVDATARCSNIATTFSTTFNVGPSPTSTATIGKLDVVATVATGMDGAAAIQIGETGAASSDETKIAIPTTASQTAAGVVAQTISSSAARATSAAVLSSDGSDVSAAQATTAAEQGYTSVELFTVYSGSTLYKVIHGTAVGGSDATSTTGGTVALQMPHTDSAGVEGSTNTEPGDDIPSSGHRWGEANWLSAVPTGAGDHSHQKKRVSRAKVMMNRSRSTNNSNLRK